MTHSRAALVSVGLFLMSGLAAGADDPPSNWRNWRGPLASGVSADADPPETWSESDNIRWKFAIPGRGSGSPIVDGNRIFLLTAIKTDRTDEAGEVAEVHQPLSPFQFVQNPSDQRERGRRGFGRGRGFRSASKPTNYYQFNVLCLDRVTGELLWQKTAVEAIPHENHHGTASFASTTPVTDGENLYVSFGSRGVYSYDLDGNLRWSRDMPPMYTRNSFGEGASPALYGDTLVINCDHEQQSFIVALDANTGEEKWKKMRDEETSWDTPLIVEHQGVVQVIVNAMNRSRSYDLATGEVLWECGGQASGPVATPIVHENLVFCMTGHRGAALLAIPLDARGDITDSDQIAWRMDRNTPYVPSPVVYDDLLYFTKSNSAILTCVEAQTGEVQYSGKRLPGIDGIYASPVAAAGRIYISGRNGVTLVLKAGPEFEVLASNKLDETIDATPALVGKEIFIRGEKHLYCIADE